MIKQFTDLEKLPEDIRDKVSQFISTIKDKLSGLQSLMFFKNDDGVFFLDPVKGKLGDLFDINPPISVAKNIKNDSGTHHYTLYLDEASVNNIRGINNNEYLFRDNAPNKNRLDYFWGSQKFVAKNTTTDKELFPAMSPSQNLVPLNISINNKTHTFTFGKPITDVFSVKL